MLGGEIYYRAIGRPWGPAADIIHVVNVKFRLSSSSQAGTGRGLPARAPCVSFGPGKKKHQGPVLPSGRNETNRNTKECGAGLADTVWDITINTRFGTSLSELQGHVGGRNILQGHRPALGAGGCLVSP